MVSANKGYIRFKEDGTLKTGADEESKKDDKFNRSSTDRKPKATTEENLPENNNDGYDNSNDSSYINIKTNAIKYDELATMLLLEFITTNINTNNNAKKKYPKQVFYNHKKLKTTQVIILLLIIMVIMIMIIITIKLFLRHTCT